MLRIDLASRVPVYEQIANGLRAELVSGKFSPGAKLPTVRTLPSTWGFTITRWRKRIGNWLKKVGWS